MSRFAIPLLLLSFGSLVVMAAHYPAATTWPIGGDVTRYILDAQRLLEEPHLLLHITVYPGTTLLLTATEVLPFSWPARFVSLIVLGHIATGAALAWLLYKLTSWREAAVSMSLWALAMTGTTTFIEDATLAQLLSLPALLLAFERVQAGRSVLALVLLGLATVLHPFSGLFGALVLSATVLIQVIAYRSRKYMVELLLNATFLVLFILALIWTGYATFPVERDSRLVGLLNLFGSPLGPFLPLAAAGLIALIGDRHASPRSLLLPIAFSISLLLTYNHTLGVGLFSFRWEPYLIVLLIASSAVGLVTVVKNLKIAPLVAGILLLALFAGAGARAWQEDAYVYNYYESPSQYARIHPKEIEAFLWLKNNTSPDTVVVSSTENRHSEWLPILSERSWRSNDTFDSAASVSAAVGVTLLHREPVRPEWRKAVELYRNDSVIIHSLSDL